LYFVRSLEEDREIWGDDSAATDEATWINLITQQLNSRREAILSDERNHRARLEQLMVTTRDLVNNLSNNPALYVTAAGISDLAESEVALLRRVGINHLLDITLSGSHMIMRPLENMGWQTTNFRNRMRAHSASVDLFTGRVYIGDTPLVHCNEELQNVVLALILSGHLAIVPYLVMGIIELAAAQCLEEPIAEDIGDSSGYTEDVVAGIHSSDFTHRDESMSRFHEVISTTTTTQRRLRESAIALANLEAQANNGEGLREELQRLIRLPSIHKILVRPHPRRNTPRVVVYTEPLTIAEWEIGRYVIDIEMGDWILIRNLDYAFQQQFPHPHVHENGKPCFGRLSERMREAMAQGNMRSLIIGSVRLVESYNARDAYCPMRRIAELTEEDIGRIYWTRSYY